MITTTYQCEQCAVEKGEGNKWLELRHTPSGAPYFREWTFEAELPDASHVCGEKCAHLVLNRHLASLRELAKEMVAA